MTSGLAIRCAADGLYSGTISFAPTAAVPEPAAWGMMIVGFGLAGAALRRRHTSVAFA